MEMGGGEYRGGRGDKGMYESGPRVDVASSAVPQGRADATSTRATSVLQVRSDSKEPCCPSL